MEAFRRLWIPTLLGCLALAEMACNPNMPVNHPGSPPVVNEARSEEPPATPPMTAPGNVKPKKYGEPALLDYARIQAGAVGPNAEIELNRDQLSFGAAAGRTQSGPHLLTKKNKQVRSEK